MPFTRRRPARVRDVRQCDPAAPPAGHRRGAAGRGPGRSRRGAAEPAVSTPVCGAPALTAGLDIGGNPRTGAEHPGVRHTTTGEVARVVAAAACCAPLVGSLAPVLRATWLESLAAALEKHTDALVALADAETALGQDRPGGELPPAAP